MSKAIQFRDKNNEKIYPCPYYPVGSIYLSVNNINPSTIFGGTWEQIKDRFLLGAGSTYVAGKTGGSASHKLTINEMPSHCHTLTPFVDVRQGDGQTNSNSASIGSHLGGNITKANADVSYTGGNVAHNNMPPYLVVYIWKRVS
ncbi:MAG: phage baseplate protein [Erysipelotrichaceae bacterium]|jgi:hypothetical protein